MDWIAFMVWTLFVHIHGNECYGIQIIQKDFIHEFIMIFNVARQLIRSLIDIFFILLLCVSFVPNNNLINIIST